MTSVTRLRAHPKTQTCRRYAQAVSSLVDNISLRSVYDTTDRTRDSDILTEVAAEVAPLTVEAEGARETHRQTHPSRVPPMLII